MSRTPRLMWRVPNEWPPAVAASVVLSLMHVLRLLKRRQFACQSASTPSAHRQCRSRSMPPACSVPPGTSATRRHHHYHHLSTADTTANTSPITTTCRPSDTGLGLPHTAMLAPGSARGHVGLRLCRATAALKAWNGRFNDREPLVQISKNKLKPVPKGRFRDTHTVSPRSDR